MKQYFNIAYSVNWEDIIQTFKPEYFTLLDTNQQNFTFAWGIDNELIQNTFKNGKLTKFHKSDQKTYSFGYVGYDAKNNYFITKSENKDFLEIPESIFYTPKHIVFVKNNHIIYFGTPSNFEIFKNTTLDPYKKIEGSTYLKLTSNTSKQTYLKHIEQIKNHLQKGDIYEMNYCMNFSAENIHLNSLHTYHKLKQNTKAPFSVYSKFKNFEILSASPERFYLKHNETIISQPIKGTAPRGNSLNDDEKLKKELEHNQKERSENIMIVDLVRNDLSKIAVKKSVIVKELCKLYSFETVHQLISTVQATIDSDTSFEDVLTAMFPMGSMTGAPKLRAIQLIEKHEDFKRNIYSGAFGYITPNNNADFNVVIRTIINNIKKQSINLSVGGAITIKSDAEDEYDECLLKLRAINKSIKKI